QPAERPAPAAARRLPRREHPRLSRYYVAPGRTRSNHRLVSPTALGPTRMYRYQLPVSGAATTASTPEAWAQEFAAATKSNVWKRLRLRLSREARLIARYIPRGQRILDAGCGFGDWVVFLGRQGYDAQGCDYSPELVRRLRRTYPDVTWTQADIRSLPFADG